jgi:hypothetical protein
MKTPHPSIPIDRPRGGRREGDVSFSRLWRFAAFVAILAGVGLAQGLEQKSGEITFAVRVAPYIEVRGGDIDWTKSEAVPFAYANCRFSATLSGENPGNVPDISRISLWFNDREYDFVDWSAGFGRFPLTRGFQETPHNGLVCLKIQTRADAKFITVPKLKITITPL